MKSRAKLSELILLCVLVTAVLLLCPAFASKKLDPEFVPPDVTLPATSGPSAVSSVSGSAGSTAPGMPGAAQPSSPQLPPSIQPPGGATATSGPPGNQPTSQKPDPIAIIETEKGNITIRLFRQYAPKTVANFIELAGKGFYNGLIFHRVDPGFCIQGGCPNGNGSGVYMEPGTQNMRFLPLETNPSLKHNAAGVVAMARFPKNPNTSSCQFYITLAAQPKLDGQYSIFGGVTSGMDVVNSIAKGDKMLRVMVQEQGE